MTTKNITETRLTRKQNLLVNIKLSSLCIFLLCFKWLANKCQQLIYVAFYKIKKPWKTPWKSNILSPDCFTAFDKFKLKL